MGNISGISDFNKEGIKHVIEYNVFKHFGGSFTYGICYNFIPEISSQGKLKYHKTDKSTKIIYSKRLDGWQKSLENNSPINPDKISTVNEEKFRTSLNIVLESNLFKLKNWFEGNRTLDQNIENLLVDIYNPPFEIGQRIISFEYILGFMFAKKNNFDSAEFWINKHFANKINKSENLIESDLVAAKFNSLKNEY